MAPSTDDTPATAVQALGDGHQIPVLGLGVWQIPNGPVCVRAVRAALDLGYRHIDTAQAYGNEESVRRAIAESGVARADIYVTTKFYPDRQDPAAEIERSLARLGTDYVDLYLVHWPKGGAVRAWPGMQRAHAAGHARSIGVSNYSSAELDQVLAMATVPPVVNQVQFSPFEYRRSLLDHARARGVAVEAYSPLGTGRHLKQRAVQAVAGRTGRTPAQVLLRWCLQKGLVVLPKSSHRERIAENARIFDFTLSADDLADLDRADRTAGSDEARRDRWWR